MDFKISMDEYISIFLKTIFRAFNQLARSYWFTIKWASSLNIASTSSPDLRDTSINNERSYFSLNSFPCSFDTTRSLFKSPLVPTRIIGVSLISLII